jgi:hypothetical protein
MQQATYITIMVILTEFNMATNTECLMAFGVNKHVNILESTI